MAVPIILGFLEVLALASCLWGLHTTWGNSATQLGLAYNASWFVLGSVANVFGMIAAYDSAKKTQPASADAQTDLLHLHYVMSWLTVVVGYPTLIASFYMNYYASPLVHVIALSSLIPIGVWIRHPNKLTSISTQLTIGILILVHGWISYSTGNIAGLCGAGAMAANLLALSTPMRYDLWGLTAREVFVTTVGLGSICFAKALDTMTKDRNCRCFKGY